MKLIWVLAFASGAMGTSVDDNGWVTQTATVHGEACVLIVCDCKGSEVHTGGEPGTIEIRYRTGGHLEAPLPFVYERNESLFIVRQENADYADDEFAIDKLKVRIGTGFGTMFPGRRDLDELDLDLHRERCRLTREAAEEASRERKRAEEGAP